MKRRLFALVVLVAYSLQMDSSSWKFEGVLGNPVENINNMNFYAQAFIPYNPIVIEVGAYQGAGTFGLSAAYPYGRVFAFEPHPEAYGYLEEKIQLLRNVSIFNLAVSGRNGKTRLYGDGAAASLLPSRSREKFIEVSNIVLDDWCEGQEIDHVDFLRLDAGGLEWQIIQSSPRILKDVIVIVAKTYLNPSKSSILPYSVFKERLENKGFELLSHWYEEGKEGEAMFIRKYMFDSLFR